MVYQEVCILFYFPFKSFFSASSNTILEEELHGQAWSDISVGKR